MNKLERLKKLKKDVADADVAFASLYTASCNMSDVLVAYLDARDAKKALDDYLASFSDQLELDLQALDDDLEEQGE